MQNSTLSYYEAKKLNGPKLHIDFEQEIKNNAYNQMR